MKAKSIIIAAILTISAGFLFAGNDISFAPVTSESVTISLAPSVPMEATFEDIISTTIDISALAPSMPSEAGFSDFAPAETIDLTNLAPLTPAVADFNDYIDSANDINALAPVTPAATDFE